MKRWSVQIRYRNEEAWEEQKWELEELSELHDLVESGPHWDTIISIGIWRINETHPGLTIEAAAKL